MNRLISILFAMLVISCARADEGKRDGYSMLLVKLTSVEYAGNLDELSESTGEIWHGSRFKIKFQLIEKVFGEFSLDEGEVSIIASQEASITKHKVIFLFIHETNSDLSVKYWGAPTEIVCLPEEAVEDADISYEFTLMETKRDQLCTNTGRMPY